MLKRFKDFLNKIDFDVESRGVKAYDFHYIMKFFLLLNGIFMNNRTSIVRFAWPLVCLITCIIAIFMMIMNIYHSLMIKDIPDFSESLCYVLIVTATVIQQIVVVRTTAKVYEMIELIEADFNEMETASDERRKIFFNNQLKIWKWIIEWSLFLLIIVISFGSKPIFVILHQKFIMEHDENIIQTRPFIFNIWLPFADVHQTPLYEIFLILNYIAIVVVMSIYGAYVAFLMQYIMHTLGQFKLIIFSFDELFMFEETEKYGGNLPVDSHENIIKNRFSDIVRRHQRIYAFCDRISDIMGPTLLYQMMLTPIELCLSAFQIADSIENGKLNFLFLLLFMGGLIQSYIPCSLGSQITEKASTAGDACYSCGWETHDATKSMKRNIQIFILRSNIPLRFNAMGILTISLETFSSILSTAGSYFTMLRQVNEDI